MRARSINGKSGKKALVILLMACMIVNLFTGCSGGRSAKRESIDYHVELETPPEPTDKIVIYQAPDMSDLIEYALATYRAKFPNVEVELKEFGNSKDMSTYAEDLENYGTVLKSELMAGQGPDVILWLSLIHIEICRRDSR